MNTNEKGDLGLGKVIADVVSYAGYHVFLPLSDTTSVDIIVANSKLQLFKFQVKYREAKNGRIAIEFSSVVNGKHIFMDLAEIDGWAIYCPDTNKVYYIMKSDVNLKAKSLSFRIADAKQKQPNVSIDGKQYEDLRKGTI